MKEGRFLPSKRAFVGARYEFKLSPQSLKAEAANQGGCEFPQPSQAIGVDILLMPSDGLFFD